MEIKEEPKGQQCNQCKSKEIVWSLKHKKPYCRDCMSFDIKSLVKKWVAVDDIIKDVIKLENKRITDNNNYISIPIKDWLDFKDNLSNSRPTGADNNDFKKVCPKCKGFKKIQSPIESESGVIDCPECMGKPIPKS